MNTISSQPILGSHVRPYDVLLGRGKTTYIHPGNELFRKEVKARSAEYHCQGAFEKEAIARAVISVVEGKNGRFLRQARDGSHWLACSQETVRSKTKQALRDDVRMRRKKKGAVRGVGMHVREGLLASESLVPTTMAFQNAERTQAFAELSTIRDIYLNDLGNNREGSLQIQTPQGRQAFNQNCNETLAVNDSEQWNPQTLAAQFCRPVAVPSPFVPLRSSLGQEVPFLPKAHRQNLAPTRSIDSVAPGLSKSNVSQPQPSLEPLPFFKLTDVKSDQSDSPTDTRKPQLNF